MGIDNQILSHSFYKPFANKVELYQDLKINEFIDIGSSSWNEEKLKHYLEEVDVSRI